MVTRVLENRMYKDPLTGLPNFLKFVDCDFSSTFHEHGVVLIFDMVNFISINKKYGRSIGDMYLKNFSEAILRVIGRFRNAAVFRTGGDEFTIVFPGYYCSEVEAAALQIKAAYSDIMREFGFRDFEVHLFMLSYHEKIESVEYFYELLIRNSAVDGNIKDSKFCRERMLRTIISNITNRIRETMAYFNDAYYLALTDDISGLPNHRAGKLHLSGLVEQCKSGGEGFSILFIDGDNLKRYNKISYDAGNQMIKRLSELIGSSLRAGDKIYRWLSGDEFLVILEETNGSNIVKLAERIRETVESQTKEWTFPITVSIGAACYPEDGSSIEQVIDKAEKANCLAKEWGKNRIIKWENTVDKHLSGVSNVKEGLSPQVV